MSQRTTEVVTYYISIFQKISGIDLKGDTKQLSDWLFIKQKHGNKGRFQNIFLTGIKQARLQCVKGIKCFYSIRLLRLIFIRFKIFFSFLSKTFLLFLALFKISKAKKKCLKHVFRFPKFFPIVKKEKKRNKNKQEASVVIPF